MIVTTTAAHAFNSTGKTVTRGAADAVGGAFWDAGNPTRITVPAGVTAAELIFGCDQPLPSP